MALSESRFCHGIPAEYGLESAKVRVCFCNRLPPIVVGYFFVAGPGEAYGPWILDSDTDTQHRYHLTSLTWGTDPYD